ncbi:MAG TPA: urease accessory protein UreD, partial [Rhodospirillales bacterium]|nr:urease accessory protein UreD [Rhodospirillales bacterium]
MSVAFSRSERPFPVHGVARISFVRRGKESRLKDLYQHDPVRVLFPNAKAGEPPQAVIVTTSGGLVGGDVIDIEARVERDAAALFTAQAAEKISRSAGEDCLFRIKLSVEPGGWLEWLPQETILFNGARMRRLTQVNLAPKAQILAGEFLVFGRKARGEKMTRGLVRDA